MSPASVSPSLLLPLFAGAALCGCATRDANTLPFDEQKVVCEAALLEVSGLVACRIDDLVPPTRRGAEPRYQVDGTVTFRSSGKVQTFEDVVASGPAADPQFPPADCVVSAIRHMKIPTRSERLVLPVRLMYIESESVTPTAAVLPNGLCSLTIPVRAP